MKRKVLAAILALTMVFGLAACGSKGASSDGGHLIQDQEI